MSKSPLSPPKWQVVENVVAAIERVIGMTGDWTVTQNALVQERTAEISRQVDVFVECPSGERNFRVGVDVKNEKRPLTIECVEQLCAKGRKLDLDRYVIVSTSGFAAQALEEAKSLGVLTTTLQELDVSDILNVAFVTRPLVELKHVEIVFKPDAEQPAAEELISATVESADAEVSITELAGAYAGRYTQENLHLPQGELLTLEVLDRESSWQRLRAGGKVYEPPTAIRIFWTTQFQRIPARRFRDEHGREVLTAVVPWKDGPRQFSLVALPNADGSIQAAVSLGDLLPTRTAV